MANALLHLCMSLQDWLTHLCGHELGEFCLLLLHDGFDFGQLVEAVLDGAGSLASDTFEILLCLLQSLYGFLVSVLWCHVYLCVIYWVHSSEPCC